MMWEYWICLYTDTHCAARGLRITTIGAYRAALEQFREYVRKELGDVAPNGIKARDVLEYVEHLRRDRNNGDSIVNRHVTILKNFYRAMVAMGHLETPDNPMAHFPRIKAQPRKLPEVMSQEEVKKLLDAPASDTVIGLRDRALLSLLYGTGARASECANVRLKDVDLDAATVRVTGKGGHERTLPLNDKVVEALRRYLLVRGGGKGVDFFFMSRRGNGMSRNAIYERVRTHARRARVGKRVTPHTVRHTFATHLVKAGVNVVTIRDLLGHRLITSTQIYLHVTAQDLREAADSHPIKRLAPQVEALLPDIKVPFQRTVPGGNTG